MHGDSLLMLTTKVVSNKKPPLLSDSESGGSTSHDTRFQLWTIEINGDNMRDSDAIAVMKKILTQYHAK